MAHLTSAIVDERVAKAVMGVPQETAIIKFAEDKIRAAASLLDQHLAGRQFMVGDTITLADIDIAAPFSQTARAKLPFKEFPNLAAWHNNLLQSFPAWAATKAELDNRMENVIESVGVKL